jgi:glycosyltransferase involved in cell wall biosynthesis
MADPRAVSATVLTKNSDKLIADCLASLDAFPEVIVLDNGSTDRTLEIASGFSNVRIHRSEFIGFGPLKNLAASLASNDWIFSVDSDEIVSPALAKNILGHKLTSKQVGTVHRRNHYRGRLIDACGWQNDISKRLYNRRHTRFSETLVHESLVGDAEYIRIVGDLAHFPFDSASELLEKAQFYSTLYARENRFRKHSSVVKAIAKSAATFIRDHVFKLGFLYGQDGLLIAASNANGAFYKYAKLAEENQLLSTSLVVTTYNRPEALDVVLMSVSQQSELPDEVIIADDGSTDETRLLIEEHQKDFPVPLVHCWLPDEGFRLARIRNKAVSVASGEYIVIVDGDMLLHRDFIKGHKRAALKGQFVQGSRVWLSIDDAAELIKSRDMRSIPSITRLGNGIQSIESPLLSKIFSRSTHQLEGVKGCNIAFWKDDCVRVNGFNEDFQTWGREDSEFAARLMNAGVKRLNLRFAGVAYHLSHKEAERTDISLNDRILERTITEGLKYCENGIAKDGRSSELGL